MNIKLHAAIASVFTAGLLCMNSVHAQSDVISPVRFSAGTEYSLIAADSVAFSAGIIAETKSALLFKLSASEEVNADTGEDATAWSGDLAFDRIDFLRPGEVRMYDLADGFTYSAGFDIKSNEEFDSQSEIISSRQLGIHYGRLGPDNYNSLDVGFRHLNEKAKAGTGEVKEDNELWSLGVTTGRRFSLTGLDSNDPLWTVSLRGQFNLSDSDKVEEALDSQQWYVSPGLQWRSDSFKLSADVLMPFMQSGELEEESDYRVRAKIQKQF